MSQSSENVRNKDIVSFHRLCSDLHKFIQKRIIKKYINPQFSNESGNSLNKTINQNKEWKYFNNAAVRDFTPEDKAGAFQGMRMIFTVMVPMIIGPAIGSFVTERFSNTPYLNDYGESVLVPPAHIFLAAAAVSVLILIPLVFLLKEWRKTEAK